MSLYKKKYGESMRKTITLENRGFTEFCACDAGYELCNPSHRFGPHVRSYHLVHFVISGKGIYKSPRGEHSLSHGDAFIIRPGEVTVYEADENEPWEYVWLGFRGALADRFSELPDVFRYDGSIAEEIRDTFSLDTGREEFLTGIVFKLYARIFGERMRSDYVNKVTTYINSHYMEDLRISGIADELGLNRKYLARIFKQSQGVSMKEFLVNKRLHEAKKLLLSGYNVEECAYMVGYNDPFGFSKAFKHRYGEPPTCFKRER